MKDLQQTPPPLESIDNKDSKTLIKDEIVKDEIPQANSKSTLALVLAIVAAGFCVLYGLLKFGLFPIAALLLAAASLFLAYKEQQSRKVLCILILSIASLVLSAYLLASHINYKISGFLAPNIPYNIYEEPRIYEGENPEDFFGEFYHEWQEEWPQSGEQDDSYFNDYYD